MQLFSVENHKQAAQNVSSAFDNFLNRMFGNNTPQLALAPVFSGAQRAPARPTLMQSFVRKFDDYDDLCQMEYADRKDLAKRMEAAAKAGVKVVEVERIVTVEKEVLKYIKGISPARATVIAVVSAAIGGLAVYFLKPSK